jgi:hypothetical protein
VGESVHEHALELVPPVGSRPGAFQRPDPPVPVRVTGSFFWDVDHSPPNFIGPNDFKTKTSWEIHPISKIEFLAD